MVLVYMTYVCTDIYPSTFVCAVLACALNLAEKEGIESLGVREFPYFLKCFRFLLRARVASILGSSYTRSCRLFLCSFYRGRAKIVRNVLRHFFITSQHIHTYLCNRMSLSDQQLQDQLEPRISWTIRIRPAFATSA